jgi:hypothetical protein
MLAEFNRAIFCSRFSYFDVVVLCVAIALGREYSHWIGLPFAILGVMLGGYLTVIFAPATPGQAQGGGK